LNNDTFFNGNVHLDKNLTVGNFSFAAVNGTVFINGSTTITGDLTIAGDWLIEKNLIVDGSYTVDQRMDIDCGPLSFRYPGASELVGPSPQDIRAPVVNLTTCCAEYLVNFAPLSDSGSGLIYDVYLTGYTLNIFNPQLSGVAVYLLYTQQFNGTEQVYSYEVGDLIFIKGSPVLSTTILLLDFEDVERLLPAVVDGNIYNGRDLVSEAMSSFTRILNSDEIFLYMYSPRPNGAELQNTPIEWVRVGLGDHNN